MMSSRRPQIQSVPIFKPSYTTKMAKERVVLENIDIINNFPNSDLFAELLKVWQFNNIPEIHQKYYYYILTQHPKAEQLMYREIELIPEGNCPIQLLVKLTRSRERCLLEAQRSMQSEYDTMQLVRDMSKFICDLRILTLNIIQQYKRWNSRLSELYLYNYQWIYKNVNYIVKLAHDFKIFQQDPRLREYFAFEQDDVFFQAIITQAFNADVQYDDHLEQHRVKDKYLVMIKELEVYLQRQLAVHQLHDQSLQLTGTLKLMPKLQLSHNQVYYSPKDSTRQQGFQSPTVSQQANKEINQIVPEALAAPQEEIKVTTLYKPPVVEIPKPVVVKPTYPVFLADEDLLEACFCNNYTGKLIEFDPITKQIAEPLKVYKKIDQKQTIVGQYYRQNTKKELIIQQFPWFKSPVDTPVFLQYHQIKMQFQAHSFEVQKQNNQPMIRLFNHQFEGEPTLQEVRSNSSDDALYLASTTDPCIKIYIYQMKEDQITVDVGPFVNQIISSYDQKSDAKKDIWIPFFSGRGNRLSLNDAVISGYLQNETTIEVNQQRSPFKSINHNQGTVIKPPFLMGIIQQDLVDNVKPLFSMIVQENNVISKSNKVPVGVFKKDQFDLMVVQFPQQDVAKMVNQIIKESSKECKQAFQSDASHLIDILTTHAESCVIQIMKSKLDFGYAIVRTDCQFSRKWVIEFLSVSKVTDFEDAVKLIPGAFFTLDNQAAEVMITQHFYLQDGQYVKNQMITDVLKKLGFRWKQQSHDMVAHDRKTSHFIKRGAYGDSIEYKQTIQFNSFYSIQASDERNNIKDQKFIS